MRYLVVLLSVVSLAILIAQAPAQTTIGSEFLVNATTTGNQSKPDVAANDDAGFVVVWTSDASGSSDVLARLYSADGKDARGRMSAAGVYFYRLEADGFDATRRMVLVE